MEKINENEQWRLNGDCSKCRREKYCSTPCTHYKRRESAELRVLVAETMNEMTGGAMADHIDKKFYGI